MSALTGKNFVGYDQTQGDGKKYQAWSPMMGKALALDFFEASPTDVDYALKLATDAFETIRPLSSQKISAFLASIAHEIEILGDDFIGRACEETALPENRIKGERLRTVNQLRMFSQLVKEGSWVNASIDLPNQDRIRDIRRMLVPLGPVIVFGASNFPLAFSVAGGDTASAFAAGNPVIVKAHPSHPGVCEYVAAAILRAAKACHMPNGIFSMLHGVGSEIGMALVKHPAAKAVGFTGSFAGGRALFDAAMSRQEPIPVYAEMSSVNPVFLLPDALSQSAEKIAEAFSQSVTLGVGQFCTNPGMVFGLESHGLKKFTDAVVKHFAQTQPASMLNKNIYTAFLRGIDEMSRCVGVSKLIGMQKNTGHQKIQASATLFSTNAETYLKNKFLGHEIFGPASIVIHCESKEQFAIIARQFTGHLTATLQGTEKDLTEYAELIKILQTKVGRMLVNDFPTGVEVCASIVHGGPYPATTDARTTSVGTLAIERFARPVCFQNFPQSALPGALKNENPLGIWRKVNNEFTNRGI